LFAARKPGHQDPTTMELVQANGAEVEVRPAPVRHAPTARSRSKAIRQ
jgi:hypothetical protein